MSAAIWSDNDLHPGLGQRTISLGDLPGHHPTRQEAVPVRLAVWGLNADDLQDAIHNAKHMNMGSGRWDITRIDQLTADTCPIQRDDPAALGQNVYYGWAWAAYPVAA